MFVDLHLSSFKSKLGIRTKSGKAILFDPIRKKKIIITPEEYVRQLLIQYLLTEENISPTKILIEKEIILANRKKRFDLVILDKNNDPQILIECKSHKEILDNKVFNQAGYYNLSLTAKYIIITNGLSTLISEIDFDTKSFRFLDQFPKIKT